jgi:hypothetical protein
MEVGVFENKGLLQKHSKAEKSYQENTQNDISVTKSVN